MSDFLRYGWPRWWLLRATDYLPERVSERLCDWLYPIGMVVALPLERDDDGNMR